MGLDLVRRVLVVTLVLVMAGLPATAQSPQVRSAQTALQDLGYEPGPVDGLMGPNTAAALQAFQADHGLATTGKLNADTTQALEAAVADVREGAGLNAVEHGVPQPVAGNEGSAETSSETAAGHGSAVPDAQTGPESEPSSGRRSADTNTPADGVGSSAEDEGSDWVAWAIGAGVVLVILSRRKRAQKRRPSNGQEARLRPRAGGPADAQPKAPARRHGIADEPAGIQISMYIGGREVRTRPYTQNGDKYWVPAGGNAEVARHRIGGMVYVGRGLEAQRFEAPDNCLIDPKLRVAKSNPDTAGERMPYWPSYSRIDPSSRLAYLQWLAGGRRDGDYSVGYAFLFFYGLERRALLDGRPPEERAAIADEVLRLKRLYQSSRSFRGYAARLLEAIAALDGEGRATLQDVDSPGWQIPLTTRLAIGRTIANGERLDAEQMFAWWWNHPETRVRTPAVRAFDEFRRLFVLRFKERHAEGLQVTPPKTRLRHHYRAASGSFEVDLTSKLGDVPDISKLSGPVEEASAVAESCMDDLAAYSRYLGRNPDGRGTLEAHALLPYELAGELPNRELEELKAWGTRTIREQGGLVLVDALLERLEGRKPKKVGRRALATATDALARLNIGLAPDPRFALRAPRIGEPVVLFELPDQSNPAQPSAEYRGALLSAMLGAFVAHADGEASQTERRRLESEIDRLDGLTQAETLRLKANLQWAFNAKPELGDFRRHLQDLPEQLRQHLGRLSIAVAGSDGHIDPGEVDALKKLYRALDLDEATVFSELHAATAQPAAEPVTVRPAQPSQEGFTIPRPPQARPASQGYALDQRQVEIIMADTAKVSAVLDEIFSEEEDANEEPLAADEPVDGTTQAAPAAGLDPDHRALVETLVVRVSLAPQEFDDLARKHGLMPGGALEILNEWAFEIWDEPLLEEDEELMVNPTIAAALRPLHDGGTHDAA